MKRSLKHHRDLLAALRRDLPDLTWEIRATRSGGHSWLYANGVKVSKVSSSPKVSEHMIVAAVKYAREWAAK